MRSGLGVRFGFGFGFGFRVRVLDLFHCASHAIRLVAVWFHKTIDMYGLEGYDSGRG